MSIEEKIDRISRLCMCGAFAQDAVRNEIRALASQMLDDAILAQCPFCREGDELIYDRGLPYHRYVSDAAGGRPATRLCLAERIRALKDSLQSESMSA